MKKYIIGFILGAVIFSGITVAAYSLASKDVEYDNTSSGIEATNLQDAVDELYERMNNVKIGNISVSNVTYKSTTGKTNAPANSVSGVFEEGKYYYIECVGRWMTISLNGFETVFSTVGRGFENGANQDRIYIVKCTDSNASVSETGNEGSTNSTVYKYIYYGDVTFD